MEILEYSTIRLILGRRNGKCSREMMDIWILLSVPVMIRMMGVLELLPQPA